MKSGLVSITISFASGARRLRIGRVKVPTPGPYSTKSLQFAQSTLSSMRWTSRCDEDATAPTITGCLKKPLRNITQGEDTPAARISARRRFAEAVDAGIEILCRFRGNRGARASAKTNEYSSAAVALIEDSRPERKQCGRPDTPPAAYRKADL